MTPVANNPAFNNPAFKSNNAATQQAMSAEQLQNMYNQPVAGAGAADRMTVEDTVVKTAVAFVVLVATAVIGWQMPQLMLVGAIVGFVLAMVNSFKKVPSAPLVLAYAAAEGLFVGGISAVFDARSGGIVVQAVLATLVVVGVTLALFASGKIRASKKATKIFMIAMIGYLVFQLVNLVLRLTGVVGGTFGLQGGTMGLIIGVLVVIMAAYSLVLDFDSIQRGVQNRAPKVYGWAGAFGIMVTVVWLYTEILRILMILRGND